MPERIVTDHGPSDSGGIVRAEKMRARKVAVGDRVWTHNAFRAVTAVGRMVAGLSEDEGRVHIEFEGGALATIQEPDAWILREPKS